MTQTPHHTVLFNIAGITMIHLSVEDHNSVYSFIEETMNGDGLYEGATKETILQAYYDMECADTFGLDWVNLISDILEQIGLMGKYKLEVMAS